MARTALVIGSGPNGLAAAIRLAQAGFAVTVHEAAKEAGGALRSGQWMTPGFVHDMGSAVHPMALSSPFFQSLNLPLHGIEWIHPPAALAHPFDDGTAVTLERDIGSTAAQLGADAPAYQELFEPLSHSWPALANEVLRPLGIPARPLLMARFGWNAVQSAAFLVHRFRTPRARALFAGLAAHSTLPLDAPISAAVGLVLGAAGHAVGWPVARGGSASIARALIRILESLGGKVVTASAVSKLADGPDVTLCDVTPRQFLNLAGDHLPSGFRRSLHNFRYGPGVCKMDWELSGPIPWKALECRRAATVHLGASFEEIAASEAAANRAQVAARPFILLVQPSLFDESRAPQGRHTVWAYCHVPNGDTTSAAQRMEDQIERFAPGFRECVLKRSEHTAPQMEAWNPNLVGGDINGGVPDWRQFFLRPTWRRYRTPLKNVFLCSSSTPPGGGVHGMCGYWAAEAALR